VTSRKAVTNLCDAIFEVSRKADVDDMLEALAKVAGTLIAQEPEVERVSTIFGFATALHSYEHLVRCQKDGRDPAADALLYAKVAGRG
jgi:hypothetical protein